MFSKKSSSPGLKRPVAEQINLQMKDTYVSPTLGLKYSHEKLLERYKSQVLSAKNARHQEVLEKVKDKNRPMDHDELYRQRNEYVSNRLQVKKERELKAEQNVSSADSDVRTHPQPVQASEVESIPQSRREQ